MNIVAEIGAAFGFTVDKRGLLEVNSALSGLKRAAFGLGAAFGVRKIFGFVEHATESATHLISMSHAMGMTVQQTQEWGYVAEQSGSSLKELSTGMNMFIRNAHEVSRGRGGKAIKELFGDAGLNSASLKNIASGSAGLNEELLKMADQIKKTGEVSRPMEALFTRMFGVRAGRAMLADLARGREGIEELFKRRRAMGELDEKQAISLRDLGNRIKDVKTAFGAMAGQVIASLAPALISLAEKTARWIAAHRDLISGAIKGAVEGLATAFRIIGHVMGQIEKLIRSALGGDEGAIALVIGLSAAILSLLVPALWAMAAPIIAASLPLIGITVVVAAISYGVIQLIKHWDKVKDVILFIPRTIYNAFRSGIGSVIGIFEDIGNAIKRAAHSIADWFSHAWAVVKQQTLAFLEWLTAKMESIPLFGRLVKFGRGLGADLAGQSGEDAALARGQARVNDAASAQAYATARANGTAQESVTNNSTNSKSNTSSVQQTIAPTYNITIAPGTDVAAALQQQMRSHTDEIARQAAAAADWSGQ